jgi:hypothetical protein
MGAGLGINGRTLAFGRPVEDLSSHQLSMLTPKVLYLKNNHF